MEMDYRVEQVKRIIDETLDGIGLIESLGYGIVIKKLVIWCLNDEKEVDNLIEYVNKKVEIKTEIESYRFKSIIKA